MNFRRRDFLATTVSAGVFAVSAPWLASAQSMPATRSPRSQTLVLVRSGAAYDDDFSAAVLSAWRDLGCSMTSEMRLNRDLLLAPAALRERLARYRGARLVGLMDDPAHIIFEEILRDLGGSLLSRGSHAASANGSSRHHFLTVPVSAGIGTRFAAGLALDDKSFVIYETLLGVVSHSPEPLELATRSRQSWPALLGDCYARIASGAWTPGPVVDTVGAGGIRVADIVYNPISFVAGL